MTIFEFEEFLGINKEDHNEAVDYLRMCSADRSNHSDPLKIALACVAIKIKKLEQKLAEK